MKLNSSVYGALLGAVFVVGCASVPLPKEELAVAKAAIENAQTAGAGQYAPAELTMAREKLDKAGMAVQAGKYDDARRLAEQAQTDAQLAQSRALSVKAKRAMDEVDKGNQVLQQEVNRPVAPIAPMTPSATQPSTMPSRP